MYLVILENNLFMSYNISEKTLYTYIDDLPANTSFPDIKISDMVLAEAVKKLKNATRSSISFTRLSDNISSILSI